MRVDPRMRPLVLFLYLLLRDGDVAPARARAVLEEVLDTPGALLERFETYEIRQVAELAVDVAEQLFLAA